jgi:PAS domain S-box-containing protein
MPSSGFIAGKAIDDVGEDARRFRALFQRSILAVLIADLEGRFIDANERALELLGRTREELLGSSIASLAVSEEDCARARERLEKVIREGALAVPVERRIRTKDGTVLWVTVEDSLLYNDEGEPYGIIAVALDITERKHAEHRDEHLRQVLSAIRQVNQLIVRESEPHALIESACASMAGVGGYGACWIALFGVDRVVSLSASVGVKEGFERFVEDMAGGTPPRCIRDVLDGEGLVVLDYPQRDPRCRGCRSACIGRGVAQVLTRIETAGTLRGILGIMLPAAIAVSAREQALVREVAGDVAFGLYRIELEEAEVSARRELAARNRLIETILENIPLGVAVVDARTRSCRYMNDSFVALHGWPARFMGDAEAFYEHVMPDVGHREEMKARVGAAVAEGRGARLYWERVKIVTQRGENRFVNVSFVPVRDQETVIVTAYDVTAMVRMEEDLVRGTERYATYMRLTSDGIYRAEFSRPVPIGLPPEEQVDLFYIRVVIAEANDAQARMYGYERGEELVGKTLGEFHGGWGKEENREFLRGFVENGYRAVDVVSREVDRTGVERFFANNVFGLVEDGFLVRIWGTQRDVTGLKRAEEALRESEERFRRLAEGIRLIPWESDIVKQRFIYVGPRAEEILGYPVERWYEDTTFWEKRIHPDDRKAVVEGCAERVESRMSDYTMEYRMITADNRVLWFMDIVNVVMEKGVPARLRGYFIDITEQKNAQAQLRRYQHELAGRNEELRRVNASLERANDVKSEFVSIASHELRTPVTTVLAFTQILLEAADSLAPRERTAYLKVIEREARRLGELAGDLLDISRIESGRIELHRESVSLRGVAGEVVDAMSIPADRSVEVVGDEWGERPVRCDPHKIRQVLGNLIENALRYGTVIRVTVTGDERYRRVDVADNGPGIAPEHREKIFGKFYRVREDAHRGKGSGLGLAIAKGIVELHGGRIWVESIVGKGSVFHFTIEDAP